jgi:glycosyltransferase involved in cell wall biosynthesis
MVVPGRIDSRTGGYEYDRRIVEGLRARGWTVDVHELDAAFPHPSPSALAHAAGVLAGLADGTAVVIDGLACGAMPDEVERERSRLAIVALVHLPLAEHPGLERHAADALAARERRSLLAASLVVVTGKATAATMGRYGVDAGRLAIVEPGTDRAPLARGSIGAPLHLLSVAALTPGKGHELLIRALAEAPHRRWLLTCAGSLDRDPATVARVRALIREHDMEECISLPGELDAASLDVCYHSADLFVLATLHETYCMAVAEALARGLPVISTRTGAIPAMVGDSDAAGSAAMLAAPGDLPGFASVLGQVMADTALRARLAEAARRRRDHLPTWDDATDRLAAALEKVHA